MKITLGIDRDKISTVSATLLTKDTYLGEMGSGEKAEVVWLVCENGLWAG